MLLPIGYCSCTWVWQPSVTRCSSWAQEKAAVCYYIVKLGQQILNLWSTSTIVLGSAGVSEGVVRPIRDLFTQHCTNHKHTQKKIKKHKGNTAQEKDHSYNSVKDWWVKKNNPGHEWKWHNHRIHVSCAHWIPVINNSPFGERWHMYVLGQSCHPWSSDSHKPWGWPRTVYTLLLSDPLKYPCKSLSAHTTSNTTVHTRIFREPSVQSTAAPSTQPDIRYLACF